LVLTNPSNGDANWNAVWYAKTGTEDSAWTVEFEIPLSQLRYSGDDEQIWGMHFWRWIDRLQEESDWEPQSSEGPGILYLFGEILGIHGLPKSQRIEIMPYILGKLKTFETEPDNPFADKGRNWLGNAGLDAKIGLSSNFTADKKQEACADMQKAYSLGMYDVFSRLPIDCTKIEDNKPD
jgi:hypothetical protein